MAALIRDAFFPLANARFIYSTKTGWSSIRLSYKFEWREPEKIPADATLFTVFRDPLDRFFSSYKETLTRSGNSACLPGVPLEEYDSIREKLRIFPFGSANSLKEYIKVLKSKGPFDIHQVSQFDSYKDPIYGRQDIDLGKIRFLDFGNINTEIRSLMSLAEPGVELGHAQVGQKFDNEKEVKAKIIEDHRSDIERLYAKDCCLQRLLRSAWKEGRGTLSDSELEKLQQNS